MLPSLTPKKDQLWFLPLGGTGEIGMNCNLYGHDDQWLMVDCGVMFNKPLTESSTQTYDVVTADLSFIKQRKEQLVGLVITHAHEDHVGAVHHVWTSLRCPVYATPFTAEILRRKLAQAGLSGQVPITEVLPNQPFKIGHFLIECLDITHSLPEPQALVIRTPLGNIFHTADWKIDANPVMGKPFNHDQFKRLSNDNIIAMLCDSTNAPHQGRSISEGACYEGLLSLVDATEQRVIVGCFGSNIARLVTLGRIANKTGRYMALLGRSLQNMVSAARVCGIWPDDIKIIESSHLSYLPRNEVLAVATGSQGEARTALNRLANHSHYDLVIEADDTVIFSSKVIPGNEVSVERLINRLTEMNVNVIESDNQPKPIHASGHPCADELATLYRLVQPNIAIPVHGEQKHMQANAAIAKANHVPFQMTGKNGDLFQLAPTPKVFRQEVKTGRVAVKN